MVATILYLSQSPFKELGNPPMNCMCQWIIFDLKRFFQSTDEIPRVKTNMDVLFFFHSSTSSAINNFKKIHVFFIKRFALKNSFAIFKS